MKQFETSIPSISAEIANHGSLFVFYDYVHRFPTTPVQDLSQCYQMMDLLPATKDLSRCYRKMDLPRATQSLSRCYRFEQ